ncbi:MAG: hypothetical protein E7300_10070 [Lachnospiraceae bacterium]|nr:hypothetical protein [Lachnospiraceae bacterium]
MREKIIQTMRTFPRSVIKMHTAWIALFVILLCIIVNATGFPGKQTQQHDAYANGLRENITLSKDTIVMGEFKPAMEGLCKLSFRFMTKGSAPDGTVTFAILDSSHKVLQKETMESGALMNYHLTDLPITESLDAGSSYYYRITASDYDDADLFLLSGTAAIGPEEIGKCLISDVSDNKEVPAIRFTYKTVPDENGKLARIACVLVLGLILCAICRRWDQHNAVPFFLVLFLGICLIRLTDESKEPITIYAGDMNVVSGYSDDHAIGLTPDSQFEGTFLKSGNYLLDAGTYTLGVSYRTTGDDNVLTLYDDGDKITDAKLPSKQSYQEIKFKLKHDCQNFTFTLDYDGESEILADSFVLKAADGFYRDSDFLVKIWVIALLLLALIRLYMKHFDVPSHARGIFCGLLLVGALASLPYIRSGLSWAIDLCYHLVRIEGIKDALNAGQFPVILYPLALKGNGYLNVMYPSLFLHIPACLRQCGVSLADSFKFLMILFHFATAFITYHSVYSITRDRRISFIAATAYTLLPYRFTNLYARGAIGEFMAMTFFPLVFSGLYHILLGEKRRWSQLTLGMVGLLGCHVLSVLYAAVFCAVICMIYVVDLVREKRFLYLIAATVCSLLMGLGFLVPFLDYYGSDILWMQALDFGDYYTTALNLPGLLGLSLTGSYYSLSLGLPTVILGSIAIIMAVLGKSRHFAVTLTCLGCTLVLMVLAFFPAEYAADLPGLSFVLGNSQFAWRLLGPAALLLIMSGCISLVGHDNVRRYAGGILACVLILSALGATRFIDEDKAYAENRTYTVGHEEKIIGIPKSKNTVVYPFEWRPLYASDKGLSSEPVPSDDSRIQVTDFEKKDYTAAVTYISNVQNETLEVPLHCYPGYEARDEAGNAIEISRGHNGRISFPVASDGRKHTVTVSYNMPVKYKVWTWISILSGIAFTAYIIFSDIRLRMKEKTNA